MVIEIFLPPGVKQSRHEDDNYFHLVPELKMAGTMYLLLLHAFMLCTGTILPSLCN
jgi:hypothetical protein